MAAEVGLAGAGITDPVVIAAEVTPAIAETVTKQIEAERALRELNETLEQRVEDETRERLQIWNVSQDLLVVADLEGKYFSVNPAWTATLGPEIAGKRGPYSVALPRSGLKGVRNG